MVVVVEGHNRNVVVMVVVEGNNRNVVVVAVAVALVVVVEGNNRNVVAVVRWWRGKTIKMLLGLVMEGQQ